MTKKKKTKHLHTKELKDLTLRQAIYLAKKEFPKIEKDTDGYNYEYASLGKMMTTLGPVLNKYSIDIRHDPIGKMGTDKSFIGMKTIVTFMATGEEDYVEFGHLVNTDKAQDMGSYQTYYRRYNLLCYFNLIPEKAIDDDGERIQERPQPNRLR